LASRASTTSNSGGATVDVIGRSRDHRVMRDNAIGCSDIQVLTGDNRFMSLAVPTTSRPVARRIFLAPFTRRAWAELGYAIISFPVAISGFVCTAISFVHPILLFVSAPMARKFGSVNRWVLHKLLGDRVPAPPSRPTRYLSVTTAEAARVTALTVAAGGQVQELDLRRLLVTGLTAAQLAELAAREQIAIEELKEHTGWLESAIRDVPAWRARAYLMLKLPVSLAMLAVVATFWLGGLLGLSEPLWWVLQHHMTWAGQQVGDLLLVPVGAAALLAAPWMTHTAIAADRALIRGLLGPSSLVERVRDLEETRARAIDDSAARLRSIERDLHDGAQAQLVGLAMKLGLAREKLGGSTTGAAMANADLDRAVELVDAAHRSAIDALTELRVLARGIHPPALDNGLPDALTTLAARSAVPVELVTDIRERPSAAIETIAYFCAAELIANVAKHSGARHATLEAVHVPGLLRVRVTDNGHGGASPDAGGGLRGLAERIRTVDGRMEISSPRGGPTVVTVELPSHA
jgi:signal transduction histidine kinase